MRKDQYLPIVLALLVGLLVANPSFAKTPAQSAPASAANPDFSGVWEGAKRELVILPQMSGTLTPKAKAAADLYRAKFDAVIDDPAKVCLARGMPWTMLSRARNYPVEIYQTTDRIFATFELYDQTRVLRINGPTKSQDYPASPNGWSVAHWDGQALVIETTGLGPLNLVGPVQRGENAKISERWTLRDDPEFGRVLDVEMTVDDPDIYVTPARAHQLFKRSPKGVFPGGYNCSAALWDDHIEHRKAELGIAR
jgi:hypothetical protein